MPVAAPPAVDRHARRLLHVEAAHLVAKNLAAAAPADAGWIEGYAATWGNVDLQKEVMERGCFVRTVQQAVATGKVKLMIVHAKEGGDVLECIGTISQAREDDNGLFIHADLNGSETSQEVRAAVLRGDVSGLSVAFRAIRFEWIKGVIHHQECALQEVTVTMHPANPRAEITAAKSLDSPQRGESVDSPNGRIPPAVAPAGAHADTDAEPAAKVTPAATPQAPPVRYREDVAKRRARLRALISGN